jgi:hypothetical protein
MAEFLLSDENRKRLAELLREARCPAGLDRQIFHALQRGERTAISIRGLDVVSHICGSGFVRTFKPPTG